MIHELRTEPETATDWDYAVGGIDETANSGEIVDTDEPALTAPDDWLGSEDDFPEQPRRVHQDKYASLAADARTEAVEAGMPQVTDDGLYNTHVVIRRGSQDYFHPIVQGRGVTGAILDQPTDITDRWGEEFPPHDDGDAQSDDHKPEKAGQSGGDTPPPEPPDTNEATFPGEEPQDLVQRTTAIVSVIDRSTQAYLDGMKFVADEHGIFAPAAGREILEGLQVAGAEPGKTFVDLGSGDGRWAVVAGAVLGMEAYGYELSGERHDVAEEALGRLVAQGVVSESDSSRVHLVQEDFMRADLPAGDVFSYYAGSGVSLRAVEAKLLAEAPDDSRLVVYRPTPGPDGGPQITQLEPVPQEPINPMLMSIYRVRR